MLRALPPVDEVIVVRGGPAGDDVARAARPGTRFVRQTGSGEGNALACGIAASRGDVVVRLRADGSADPAEISRLVAAVRAGADIAHTSRFRPGGEDLTGGRPERAGAAVVSRVVNTVLGTRCTDPLWGYFAVRHDALPDLGLPVPQAPGRRRARRVWGEGPEIDPLIIVRAARAGLRVVEVAGMGYPRIKDDGRRDVFRRVLLALRALLTELLPGRRSRGRSAPASRGRRSATAVRPAAAPGSGYPGRPAGRHSAAPATTRPRTTVAPATAHTAATPRTAAVPATARTIAVPVTARATDAPAPRATDAAPGAPQRRAALPSGLPAPRSPLPGGRTDPHGGTPGRAARRGTPPDWPAPASGLPSAPPAGRGTASPAGQDTRWTAGRDSAPPAGGDSADGWPGHRRGHPGPRPAWAAREPGAHRTVDHDSGAHRLPDGGDPMYGRTAPSEPGGGRVRLDAQDRRAGGRPGLRVIPGEGGPDVAGHRPGGTGDRPQDTWRRGADREGLPRHGRDDGDLGRDRRGGRPGHLRAVPGERFPR